MKPQSRSTTRRALIGSLVAGAALSYARTGSTQTPAVSPPSTPSGTPVASSAAFDPLSLSIEDVLPRYEERVVELRALGRHALDLFFAGKDDDLRTLLAPAALEAFANQSSADILASLQTNRLQFAWPEVGAFWDASFTGGDEMTGFFDQGTVTTFTLTAESAQNPGQPTGRWTGMIDGVGIEFSVEFAGPADELSATLDIPAQQIVDQPLANVAFAPERPIDERVEERALPYGSATDGYVSVFAWGDAFVTTQLVIDPEGRIATFSLVPAWPVPADPAAGYVSDVTYRLPVDGLWHAFWAGDTELENYHVAYPNQRHAVDLLIWNDGATHAGDGTRLEDYFAWGQVVRSPASGTVVSAENGMPDMQPGEVLATMDPARAGDIHPAGNHVIIETADAEFVVIGHMREGSVRVKAGAAVRAGDPVGLTGNSGNTSEPHIHVHVQNTADFFAAEAIGIPLAFSQFEANGKAVERAPLAAGQFITNAAAM